MERQGTAKSGHSARHRNPGTNAGVVGWIAERTIGVIHLIDC
jgi:hypothetical protein